MIGLKVRADDRDQVELEAGQLGLTIHQSHSDAPPHHSPTISGSVRLGLHVDDLGPIVARLALDGALCLSLPEERDGVIMALYEDPDGHHLSLAADVRD